MLGVIDNDTFYRFADTAGENKTRAGQKVGPGVGSW